ncbi:alpha/beta fold hydrolase [Glacieibacterium sp.]|uniref:alpha/beta fold hydrolase n=1 Tax=Glacieibacterium sp. TaxID=2860237 RepID=UPI003B00B91A
MISFDLVIFGLLALGTASPPRAPLVEPPPTSDLSVFSGPQRLVSLPGGRRMNIYCTGSGGPTVILEGGWTSWTSYWRKVQPAVARTTRVCSYDRAGYGFSDPGPMPRTAAAIADDLAALLKAAQVPGPYVLVAHSAGALDVRLFASEHPSQVAAMILVEPAVEYQDRELGLVSKAYAASAAAFARDVQACAEAVIDNRPMPGGTAAALCISPPAQAMPAAVSEAVRKLELSEGYQRTAASELANYGGTSSAQVEQARHSLGKLPLLVLTAANSMDDPTLPADEQAAVTETWWGLHDAVAKLSTAGKHRLVTGSDHFVPMQQPQAVIDAIAGMVAGVRATALPAIAATSPGH